jgi:hypothetical protein
MRMGLYKHISRRLMWVMIALIACLMLLPLAPSLAQNGSVGGSQAVIQGPWRVADQNPIRFKNDKEHFNDEGFICVIGADRTDGNVELVVLSEKDDLLPSGLKLIGYDNEGITHDFIEVTSSSSQGDRKKIEMRVYQLETPAKTGFQIVSVAMMGNYQEFKEARIREQVSRVKNDMRSMATAIESYYVDNNSYPTSTTEVTKSIHASAARNAQSEGWRLPAFELRGYPANGSWPPMTLTTPVAYITRYMDDPFTNQPGHTYQFYSTNHPGHPVQTGPRTTMWMGSGGGWILWSPGPDGKYDVDWQKYYPNDTTATLKSLYSKTYDPTNGTISGGDIWRIKQ